MIGLVFAIAVGAVIIGAIKSIARVTEKVVLFMAVLCVLAEGFRRAAFSNEACVGSASIAHSEVMTTEPATDGFVSLLEPFIDTVAPWFPFLLAVAVLLFAFSAMMSWSYYGMKATGYLFNDSARAEFVFKIVFCIFTVIGASLLLGPVIAFSDSMIFAMLLANFTGL